MNEGQTRHREEKLLYWRPQIEGWRQSGKRARAYCLEQGLDPAKFKYWQYIVAPDSRQAHCKPKKSPFSKVNISALTSPTITEFEVTTLDGYQIKCRTPHIEATLSAILNTLRSGSC